MPELRLLRLEGRNYRSWPHLVYVPPASGVVLVRGRNLQSRTSSATGKSSLLSAIASALGCGPPATATKSWWADESHASLQFSWGERVAAATRGTSTFRLCPLDRIAAKPLPSELGKIAEEELRRLTGSPKLLKAMTWRMQRRRGHFFSKTPVERRDFLAEVLGLESLEAIGAAAKKEASKLSGEVETTKAWVFRTVQRMNAAKGRSMLVGEEDLTILQRLMASEADLVRVVALLERLDAEEREAQRHTHERRSAIQTEVVQIDALINKLDRHLQTCRSRLAVAAGQCPTCGTVFTPKVDVEAEEGARHTEASLASLRAGRADAVAAMPLPPVPTRTASDLNAARRELGSVRSELERIRVAGARKIAAAQEAAAEADRAAEEVRQGESKLEELTLRMNEEADLASWERAWQNAFGAEILADLSTLTNEILAQVPNVSNVTLLFEARVTTSGKQEIGDRIFVDGAEREDGLSEGQLSSVELASDLALREIVGARSLVRPAWVVLDEPFEGMGIPDQEAFLDWMSARNDLFFVIDHSREFSELFVASGIGVEMNEGRSRIVSDDERRQW